MILISHRGNINGINSDRENTISYIQEAIDSGYDVEIDICKWDGKNFFLGHDNPQEKVSEKWLLNNPLWCHAKNFEVLNQLLIKKIHCFWHESDRYTLTSKGFVWAYPGQTGGKNTIAVHPEKLSNGERKKLAGVCSDYVKNFL